MPFVPIIIAPVGKSGPGRNSIISAIVISGFLANAIVASIVSAKLCGGMLVDIPTAIPDPPETNKLGKREGNTEGSFSVAS